MTLPLLASVPHAGLWIPEEIRGFCILTPEEIAADGDVGADEAYAIAEHVEVLVTTEVARAILDMNRGEDDRSRDGVIKTHTCWNVPVYREPLPDTLADWLLEYHYRPYHSRLREAARENVKLGVDLHTMAAHGPPVGPDPGKPRPAVCLSNADGTCPRQWIETLRDCLASEFAREVRINDPFRGGFITRTHAAELPWLQVELSREPWTSWPNKRAGVLRAFEAFCANL